MEIKDIMLRILKALYDRKYSNIEFNMNSFDFEDGRHEAAFYLTNLERDGFVEFEGEVIVKGGQRHSKYHNSVAAIWWKQVYITKAGEEELKENNLI